MVRDRSFEEVEPEGGNPREDLTFVRDARPQYMVERGDPVGRYKQEISAQRIDVAHLTPGHKRQPAESRTEKRIGHRKTVTSSILHLRLCKREWQYNFCHRAARKRAARAVTSAGIVDSAASM